MNKVAINYVSSLMFYFSGSSFVLPSFTFYPCFTQLPRVKLGKTILRFYPPTLLSGVSLVSVLDIKEPLLTQLVSFQHWLFRSRGSRLSFWPSAECCTYTQTAWEKLQSSSGDRQWWHMGAYLGGLIIIMEIVHKIQYKNIKKLKPKNSIMTYSSLLCVSYRHTLWVLKMQAWSLCAHSITDFNVSHNRWHQPSR